MGRWMKLVFVNPERVRSDEESVHLLFDMTDPAQEEEVRQLRGELAEGLKTADEYRASGGYLQVASQNPQGYYGMGNLNAQMTVTTVSLAVTPGTIAGGRITLYGIAHS